MISDFFIRRPVLAIVFAILIVVIGIVALFALPVAQYPDVVPPTVQVTTRYPGASARTVIDAVALPIEQQVNGVEGMIYMQSYSAADGTYTLTVTFKIGIDLNVAQILVADSNVGTGPSVTIWTQGFVWYSGVSTTPRHPWHASRPV